MHTPIMRDKLLPYSKCDKQKARSERWYGEQVHSQAAQVEHVSLARQST
jgi:hypothetical protein